MNELFIPIELAKGLRTKGFNLPCIACYDGADMLSTYSNVFEPKNYNLGGATQTSAPLYQQVFDWFMDKHEILIHPDLYINSVTGVAHNQYVIHHKIGNEWKKIIIMCGNAKNVAIERAIQLI